MQKVVELQRSLAGLSTMVDDAKAENSKIREDNIILKDYLNNLMGKVGAMPNLGTTAPSRMMVHPNQDGAQAVLVNEHIGELTAPAMDD